MFQKTRNKQIQTLTKPDDYFLSWFAGFWEGEGTFCISPKETRINVIFSVAQKNRKPLDLIQKTFGGSILCRKRDGNHNWQIHKRKKIIQICKWMLPFLKFRNEQVEIKLKVLEDRELFSQSLYWQPQEKEFLFRNYKKYRRNNKLRELAQKLNRTYSAIVSYYYHFHLTAGKGLRLGNTTE